MLLLPLLSSWSLSVYLWQASLFRQILGQLQGEIFPSNVKYTSFLDFFLSVLSKLIYKAEARSSPPTSLRGRAEGTLNRAVFLTLGSYLQDAHIFNPNFIEQKQVPDPSTLLLITTQKKETLSS